MRSMRLYYVSITRYKDFIFVNLINKRIIKRRYDFALITLTLYFRFDC